MDGTLQDVAHVFVAHVMMDWKRGYEVKSRGWSEDFQATRKGIVK